jgi:tetratricopeptide (TPR) repeat protein
LNQAAALNYQAYEQTQEQRFLDEAKRYLNKLVSREPNYQLGLYLNYLVHVAAGDNDNALKLIMDVIEMNKYGQSYYEQAASTLLEQWDEERKTSADRSQTEEEIIRLYKKMIQLKAGIDALPETVYVSKPFEVPNSVRAVAGQVYYFKGDYAQAEEVLKPGLKEDLSQPNDRYVARFYLASLRKQGKNDPALYEKLLQADQGEGAMLEQLLQ